MSEPLKEYESVSMEHVRRLRKVVNAHSVDTTNASQEDLKEMVKWCEENVGDERPYHPIHEADEGWMDYFEGEWAFDRVDQNFWFFDQKMLVAFMLRWAECGLKRVDD